MFHRFGHPPVDHVADIRLVDSHSERDRSHDDVHLFADEGLLIRLSFVIVHPRMIGNRAVSRFPKARRYLLNILTADAIHDPRFLGMAMYRGANAVEAVVLSCVAFHAVNQIGTVESPDQNFWTLQGEFTSDVRSYMLRRRGRIRMDGNTGEHFLETAEIPVLGPEIVAPLADAVGLVHNHKRDIRAPHILHKAVHHEPFRSDIQELQRALTDARINMRTLFARETTVDAGSRHAALVQLIDLVLH